MVLVTVQPLHVHNVKLLEGHVIHYHLRSVLQLPWILLLRIAGIYCLKCERYKVCHLYLPGYLLFPYTHTPSLHPLCFFERFVGGPGCLPRSGALLPVLAHTLLIVKQIACAHG